MRGTVLLPIAQSEFQIFSVKYKPKNLKSPEINSKFKSHTSDYFQQIGGYEYDLVCCLVFPSKQSVLRVN